MLWKFFDKLMLREKLEIILAIFIMFLYLCDQFVIRPVSNAIDSIDREIQKAKLEYIYQMKLLSRKEEIIEKYKALNKVSFFNTSDSEIIDIFNSRLDEIIKRSGIEVDAIEPVKPFSFLSCKDFRVSISKLTSSFKDFLRFLYDIYNSNDITVRRINLKSLDQPGVIQGAVLLSFLVVDKSDLETSKNNAE